MIRNFFVDNAMYAMHTMHMSEIAQNFFQKKIRFFVHRDQEDIEVEAALEEFYAGQPDGYWSDGSFYTDDPPEIKCKEVATASASGANILLTAREWEEAHEKIWESLKKVRPARRGADG
jgi:hypothetical protein